MIDIISSKHIPEVIKGRRLKYTFDSSFYVLTNLNHLFLFDFVKDISLRKLNYPHRAFRSSRIMALYGLEYKRSSDFHIFYHQFSQKIEAFYESCINDLRYTFYSCNDLEELNWLEQELINRGINRGLL